MNKTVTSLFMLPTLKLGKQNLMDNGFINAFVKDAGNEIEHQDAIYIVFKPVNRHRFRIFLEELYETDKAIDDYDYEDGIVVVVCKLNSDFKKDFKLVKQGKYSKTSMEFQNSFAKLINPGKGTEEFSMQYRIFNKAKDIRNYWETRIGMPLEENSEVWTGFFMEYETFNPQTVNKPVENNQIN